MSSSLHVVGFKPPDDKWRKMKAVYDACKKAGICAPITVTEFFAAEEPDDAGVTVEMATDYSDRNRHASVTEYRANMVNGFDVDLSKLPKDVTIVRFYVSY